MTSAGFDRGDLQALLTTENTLAIEGEAKPALIAHTSAPTLA